MAKNPVLDQVLRNSNMPIGTTTEVSTPDRLLKAENTAPILDITVRTLREWTSDRKIPHVKIGHTVRYRLSDLMTWADERRVAAET